MRMEIWPIWIFLFSVYIWWWKKLGTNVAKKSLQKVQFGSVASFHTMHLEHSALCFLCFYNFTGQNIVFYVFLFQVTVMWDSCEFSTTLLVSLLVPKLNFYAIIQYCDSKTLRKSYKKPWKAPNIELMTIFYRNILVEVSFSIK